MLHEGHKFIVSQNRASPSKLLLLAQPWVAGFASFSLILSLYYTYICLSVRACVRAGGHGKPFDPY